MITDKKRLIVVKFTYAATHRWENCNIEEVSYLKYPHRHLFHIEMHKEVNHNDRDIEIIMFKESAFKWLENHFKSDFGTNSCESIAEALLDAFKCDLVQVLEDNENGAIIKAI